MKDRTAATRSQQHEIVIDAPVEAVWKAITDGEELTRWFVDAAKVEPGVGGKFWLSWDGAEAGGSRIDVWEPNQRLRVTLAPFDMGPAKYTADINLPYSSISRDYLLAEGFPADRVIKTGSPLFEVLNYYRPKIDASDALTRLGVEAGKYFLVSAHRAENVDSDDRIRTLAGTLEAIAKSYGEPVLVSTHPRTRKRIDLLGIQFHPLVRLLKPFGFLDYNALQLNAHAVLSDSGSISEESAILGFPAVNLRDAHERPEAMEQAVVTMTGLGSERVLQALDLLAVQQTKPQLPADYAVPDVSEKIVRIILSYADYVRRTVWKEY